MSFSDLLRKKIFFAFSVFVCFLYFFNGFNTTKIPFAHGQSALVTPTNALRISVVPEFPGPFEDVNISVENFSTDLNKTTISWSLNGKVQKSGVGLKRFVFKSGALGSETLVDIDMGGDVQRVSIRPASVDLLWQADTYTPPFYLGKALHSNQDPVTVVAEPFLVQKNGIRLDPTQLIYKWKKNGVVVDNSSGYGKKSFQVNGSILLKPIEISVDVSSQSGEYQATASIVVPDTQTETLLYENNPLYGIMFGKELTEKAVALSDTEIRIMSIPLYFSNQQKNGGLLEYRWSLNNITVNQQGNEVIFRKPDGTASGKSLISLAIENKERFTQSSNASTNITYNTEEQGTESQPIF